MPTRTRRFVRRMSPMLARLEPMAIFGAYSALAGMALFSWLSPPAISDYVSQDNLLAESILLSVGSLGCIYGHIFRKEIVELIGLIFALGGTFVFLWITVGVLTVHHYLPIGQIMFLVVAVMGFMFSHALTLQSSISSNWLKPHPAMFTEIYND